MTTDQNEVARQILNLARAQDGLKDELLKLAEQVRDYWKSIAPVGNPKTDDEAGAYAASIKVFKKIKSHNGFPMVAVGATDYKAHWVEYGTGQRTRKNAPKNNPDASPGTWDGSAPAAPRAKTAAHFKGDESSVQDIIDQEPSREDLIKQLSTYKFNFTRGV